MTLENNGNLPKLDEQSCSNQIRRGEITDSVCERDVEPCLPRQTKGNVHFKILVPSIAAGAIIGKGGEAITEIQNQTAAKVKMSKANDFYPGTTERVCLIVGTTESILRVFQYISEKIYEKPESLLRTPVKGCRLPAERHKQVKILVPNSTAGIIIGKGGSFIKEVKEHTGVFIQVSQKSKELNLAERCVTIAGELSQTYEAVKQLLSKIADDPQSSSCPNISYAEIPRPVASAYPTGSPYALVLGSGYPPSGTDSLIAGGSGPNSVSSSTTFQTQQQQRSFSPINTSGSTLPSGSMFGTSQSSAIAAAMAVMGSGSSFSPCISGCSRSGSLLSTSTSSARALTGRGSTTGRAPSISPYQSQNFIGTSVTSICGATPPVFASPGPMGSPSLSSSTMGLEAVRNILRSAGYSDAATEEIANAMNVLNLYGFISMSSLTSCTTGANSLNNGNFSIASGSLSELGPPAAFAPGATHPPMFSVEHNQIRGMRGFSISGTPYQQHTTPNQQSRSLNAGAASFTNPRMHPGASTCHSSLPFIRDECLVCVSPSVTCDIPDSGTLVTGNLYSNLPAVDASSLQSPGNSPLMSNRPVSPMLSVIPRTGTNGDTELSVTHHDFLNRMADNNLSGKLNLDKESSHSSTDNGTNGNGSISRWSLGCRVLQPTNATTT